MSRHYVVCDCGHKNFYDKPFERPSKCEKCHRSLLGKVALEAIDDPDLAPIGNQTIDNPNIPLGNQVGDLPLHPEKMSGSLTPRTREETGSGRENNRSQAENRGEESALPGPSAGGETMLALETLDGRIRLIIPREGAVIGRGKSSLGYRELRSDEAISREHLRVRYQMTMGLLVEDLSRFGTTVNGQRLQKGKTQFVPVGSTIYLYDFPMIVTKVVI